MKLLAALGFGLALIFTVTACSGDSDKDVRRTTATPTKTTIAVKDIEFPDVFDQVQKDTIVTIPSGAVACRFGEQEAMPFASQTPSPGGAIGSVTCQSYREAALAKLAQGAPKGASTSTPEPKANGLMTSAIGFGAFVVGSNINPDDARILRPGEAVEYDGAQCVAADDGVRCQGTNEPGFVLSETDYRMLKS